MKKIFCIVLAALILGSLFPVNAYASEADTVSDTIRFEDGSYVIVTLTVGNARATNTKYASKRYTFYNAKDVVEWQAVLSGTFTYNGFSSVCSVASCNITIYADHWSVVSKVASPSANTANAAFQLSKTILGITTLTPTYRISLSCDVNGNLT